MRFFFSLLFIVIFLFDDCSAGDNGLANSSIAHNNSPFSSSAHLFSLPWNSASMPHYVKKDTADTTWGKFPVWQRKVESKNKNVFNFKNVSELRPLIKPGLIFSAIAFNWTSFYLKRRADDYYKDYQRTSVIRRMNNSYKKAALYDNLAAI